MRLAAVMLGMAAYATSFATAASLPNTSQTSNQPGQIRLDSSKNVYFDQFSSTTFALQVLQAKNQFNKNDLILGGSLEADYQRWHGNRIETTSETTYQNGNGLYLTQLSFDVMGNVNHWSTGFISVIDSRVGRPESGTNNVYLSHAFLLLGDLNKTPFYFTFGINTLPFGSFATSGPWNSPLTSDYFNPSQGPLVGLSYYKDGLNLSAAGFGDTTNQQNDFVYSVYYNKTIGNFSYNAGAGYLTDLKSNNTTNTNTLRASTQLPVWDFGAILDFNAGITYKTLGFTAEYLRANSRVSVNSAKPQAYGLTASYAPTLMGQVTTFGIGYSRTLFLNDVPTLLAGQDAILFAASGLKSNWAATVSRPIFGSTANLGFDFEKSTAYSKKHSYTGTVDLMLYL